MGQSGGEDFLATPRLDEPDSGVLRGEKNRWCPFWRAGDRWLRVVEGHADYSSDLEGTLLVYLLGLPKAKRAHVYITHPHTERGMSILLVFVAITMMAIIILHSIGGRFEKFLSWPLVFLPMFAYIPACNWLILTDVRALRLLLRQFEVWFVFANWVLAMSCLSLGLFTTVSMTQTLGRLMVCGLHAIIMDAVRVPSRVVFLVMIVYGTVYSIIAVLLVFKLMSETDYRKTVSNVALWSFFAGRLITVIWYYWRYVARLFLSPETYVVLRKPILRRNHRAPAVGAESTGRERDLSMELSEATPLSEAEGVSMISLSQGPLVRMDSTEKIGNDPTKMLAAQTRNLLQAYAQPVTNPMAVAGQEGGACSGENSSRPDTSLSRGSVGSLPQTHTSSKRPPNGQARIAPEPSTHTGRAPQPQPQGTTPRKERSPHSSLSPRPQSSGPASQRASIPTGQEKGAAQQSTNYAYSPIDGYDGLLLHWINPAIAELWYPLLTSPKLEKVINILTQIGSLVPTAALVTSKLPTNTMYLALLLYVPALHRFAFLDIPVLRLLLQDFETWFILINWALQLMNVAWFGLFSDGAPTNCIWNLIFANTNSLLLDAARLPIGIMRETTIANSCACITVVTLLATKKMLYTDYQLELPGGVNAVSFHLARMFVLGVYSVKNMVRLHWHPEAYVTLRKPLLRKDTQGLMVRTLREGSDVLGVDDTMPTFMSGV